MPVVFEPLSKRIERGVALLDRVDPDWREKVNPAILAMQDPEYCVVGQLTTPLVSEWVSFAARAELLGTAYGTAWQYGFDIYFGDDPYDIEYSDLDRAWTEVLAGGLIGA